MVGEFACTSWCLFNELSGVMFANAPHTWIFHFVNSVDEVTVVCCQPCWQVYNVLKQIYKEASMKLHTEKREEAHVALTGLSRKPRLYNMITTRHFSDSENGTTPTFST